MNRDCNSVEGIKEYLSDLKGLNQLIKDRRQAACGPDGQFVGGLKEFVILGRWTTNSSGSFGDTTYTDASHRPLDVADRIPPVVLQEDLFKLGLGIDMMSVNGLICCVPPTDVHCRECGRGWSVHDAHDAVVTTDTIPIDVSRYVGRTYRDLDADLRAKTDGFYFVSYELPVHGERFIDPAPISAGSDLARNRDGWVNLYVFRENQRGKQKASDLAELYSKAVESQTVPVEQWDPLDYVFQEGDRTYAYARWYTHQNCLSLKKTRESRAYYLKLFIEAGFPEPVMIETPNERCSCVKCGPWFIGRFPFGDIKIGWRKSVMNIDWSGVAGKPNFRCLFDGEGTTHDATYVHAQHDNAVKYLARLKQALDTDIRCGLSDCNQYASSFKAVGESVVSRCSDHRLYDANITFLEALTRIVHQT